MAEIFVSDIRLEDRLKDTAKHGFSFCLQALTRDFCKCLYTELKTGPFELFFDLSLGVYQKFSVFSPDYFCKNTLQEYPLLRELGDNLGQLVRARAGSVKPLRHWQPNDVAVQCYSDKFEAIGKHRDFASDIHLVASFTVCGTGELHMFDSRDDMKPSNILQTGPGSLLLMRAPGLVDSTDDIRPVHMVMPPISAPRISVTYRLATKPGLKGP